MNKSLPRFGVAQSSASGILRLAAARRQQRADRQSGSHPAAKATAGFPKRPDLSVLSETIPLFYIGQNRYGFWVAREAEGRSGGLFVCRRSAVRFARKRSEPAGYATMLLREPIDLDIENEGSRVVAALSSGIAVAARFAPGLVSFLGMAVAEWRKLVSEISRAFAGERRNRAAIEQELFRGQYRLSSKNDDDLPVP